MMLATGGLADITRAQQQPQKVEKKLVMYQPTPKNGQSCNQMRQFPAAKRLQARRRRHLPAGWCQLFAPKPT
jgi:hypothetical protein